MKYYQLLYDYKNDSDYIYCEAKKEISFGKDLLYKGEIIRNWDENTTFIYDRNDGNIISDYIANSVILPMMSEKFYNIFQEKIEDSVQFLPVLIEEKDTTKKNSAYILNVLSVIDGAIDFEESDFDIFKFEEIEITSFRKHVLIENNIGGMHIFRLKEDPLALFVSEQIKDLIDNSKLKGFDYFEISLT